MFPTLQTQMKTKLGPVKILLHFFSSSFRKKNVFHDPFRVCACSSPLDSPVITWKWLSPNNTGFLLIHELRSCLLLNSQNCRFHNTDCFLYISVGEKKILLHFSDFDQMSSLGFVLRSLLLKLICLTLELLFLFL